MFKNDKQRALILFASIAIVLTSTAVLVALRLDIWNNYVEGGTQSLSKEYREELAQQIAAERERQKVQEEVLEEDSVLSKKQKIAQKIGKLFEEIEDELNVDIRYDENPDLFMNWQREDNTYMALHDAYGISFQVAIEDKKKVNKGVIDFFKTRGFIINEGEIYFKEIDGISKLTGHIENRDTRCSFYGRDVKDRFSYTVHCAQLTEHDQFVYETFYPLFVKRERAGTSFVVMAFKSQVYDDFVFGRIGYMPTGASWIAQKKENGWEILHVGQQVPTCDIIAEVPLELYSQCFDPETNILKKRTEIDIQKVFEHKDTLITFVSRNISVSLDKTDRESDLSVSYTLPYTKEYIQENKERYLVDIVDVPDCSSGSKIKNSYIVPFTDIPPYDHAIISIRHFGLTDEIQEEFDALKEKVAMSEDTAPQFVCGYIDRDPKNQEKIEEMLELYRETYEEEDMKRINKALEILKEDKLDAVFY
ncbi:hypothetical protein KKG22_01415 [Patescibacteria group bacterium]|nr:hypothetical protein [Patescibacteria group bacterium]MBU1721753.1 hypothetical protein [Patescibacteria group bacterium]MBU1901408.1 hypothetical protein [Patescibacteria group bacterium]